MKIAPSTIGRRYGWHRSPLPNLMMRHTYEGELSLVGKLPPKLDLLKLQPAVFDQGQEGSCTANSACGEAQYLHRLLAVAPDDTFSRQLLYYLEREDQGSRPDEDAGSSIAESVAAMEKYGLALERNWPYDPAHFSMKPTDAILKEAAQHKILSATRVSNTQLAFKSCISQGRGVMIGFTVYESFESQTMAKTGVMPMPKMFERVLGGHAVRIIGYDDTLTANGRSGYYLVRNSWGNHWAQDGNFWMPYDFVHKARYASDFHRLDKTS